MSSTTSVSRDLVFVVLTALFLCGVIFYFDIKSHHESIPWNALLDHALAIIAILAGVLAVRYELRLDKGFEHQRQKIQDIVQSVHTRYIGNWPEHTSEIAALVKETQPGDQLVILVDFLGYAHFTRYDLFRQYLNELQKARHRGVTVKVLLDSEPEATKSVRDQFKKESEDSEAAKELARAYQERFKDWINIDLQTYNQFITAMLYINGRFCDVLVDTTAPPSELAAIQSHQEIVFYWIVRRGEKPKNMIFAYSEFSDVGQGYGFRTEDLQLMSIFSRDFENKWKNASRIRRGSELFPAAWRQAENWKQVKQEQATLPPSEGRPKN
jgi:hypothetical protein